MGLIPDRSPESRAPTVADVVPQANEIRLESTGRRHRRWIARVGPRGRGLEMLGRTPREAAEGLLDLCERSGWVYDETWRDAT